MSASARLIMILLAAGRAGSLAAQEKETPASALAAIRHTEKVRAAAADPLDAQAMQYEQMLHPAMWRELEFIRQTCDLAREQRPRIKAAADAGVKKAAKDYITQMQRGRQGDPGLQIRKELLAALETTLTEEQMARYKEEAARRAVWVKKATVRSVVAQLDEFLFLSREQRDKISQSLDKNWQDDWEKWLMIWRYGGRYFPMIPDQHLTPHLSPQQKNVWQGAQKIEPGFWGGGGLRQEMADDWWDGKDEADAKPQTNGARVKARVE